MRNKRFLAAVAIAISMSLSAPVMAFATEADEISDTVDDEQEEGEQTTIMAPDADEEGGAGSGGSTTDTGGASSSGTASQAKSSDSSLSHLGISPGSLSPAFSAGTHEYTATVDANVTAISVAAKPNSSNAVIASVSGAKSLKAGSNTVKVVVEAENGATSTYTITVICGSATASAPESSAQDNPDPAQGNATDTPGPENGEQAPEGEILPVEDADEEQKENTEVTFDDNGYLIYEGNAYLPSSMMPEGEYVSLDKYNKLYEQSQKLQTTRTRIVIIFIVLILLLLIVILNLALKLRDMRQDAKLGLNRPEDDEQITGKQADTSMIPDVVIPEPMKSAKKEKPVQAERTAKAEKLAKTEKPVKAEKSVRAEKQTESSASKPAQSAKQAEDLEILDLNDL